MIVSLLFRNSPLLHSIPHIPIRYMPRRRILSRTQSKINGIPFFRCIRKKCLDFLLRIRYNSRATRRVVRAGRRSTTGNRVSRQRGFEGSNPLLSAKKRRTAISRGNYRSFYFAGKHTLCRQRAAKHQCGSKRHCKRYKKGNTVPIDSQTA